MGLQVQVLNAGTSREINAAFASLGRERPDALFVGGDGFFNSRHVQIVNLASRHAVPATYADRLMAEAGGLMSYGSDIVDAWRQFGVYVSRILNSRVPSRRTCRSCRRPSSSWSSTPRPPGCSASKCRRHCSRAPTR